MLKRSAFTAERVRGINFERLFGGLFITAFADEPEDESNGDSAQAHHPQVNFEQLVAQARKEEKDKLYPRIKKLEEENKTLTTANNKYLLEIATLKEELEKVKTSNTDNKELEELKTQVATLEAENKTLKESTPDEEAIREKVKAEYEVKMYAQEQITANKGDILSILIPEITGNTKEEVDQAVASAKEKTLAIKKDLGIEVDEGGDSKKSPETSDKGEKKDKPKTKKVPPAVPTNERDEFDPEYVRNLDPRSEEYLQFRKKMGLR